MSENHILQTDKSLDALSLAMRPKVRLLTFEGTVRSSKTVTAIEAFFYRVFNSESYFHLIGARDFECINDNILEADGLGLLRQFSRYCFLKKETPGGFCVKVRGTPTGEKKIKLAGYADAGRWKKVLGGSIENIYLDEVNIANKQFVDECFARQVSFQNPLTIFTLNGDIPTHCIYTNYINKSSIIGSVPASIRADMDRVKKEPGYYYMHWTFSDNPIMSKVKIERAKNLYPVGSYYHTIKILGERGSPGEMIYVDYISDDLVAALKYDDYTVYSVGVDIGAKRAQNSFTLTGYKNNFTECAIMDNVMFNQCGYNEKTKRLRDTIYGWKSKGIYIDEISVDSAEQNYIADLKPQFAREGLPPVRESKKYTIKERIDLNIILMAAKRIKFNSNEGGRRVLQAFKLGKWAEGKAGEEREDNNEWQNDVMDSTEYSQTRHMAMLLFNNNRGEKNKICL